MWIHLYPQSEEIIFSLETKDFISGTGHKFIQELKFRLPNDYYITYKFLGKIIFIIDYFKCFGIFCQMYRKYYPKQFQYQKIKVKWYEFN